FALARGERIAGSQATRAFCMCRFSAGQCHNFSVKESRHRSWQVIVGVAIAVVTLWMLYAVRRSPHRSDLAAFGAFAVAVVALALGWIGWAWRARANAASATTGKALDDRADLLAEAVRQQWERAAQERGLVIPEPIPVPWARPALALAG